jgi:hypothetical protein
MSGVAVGGSGARLLRACGALYVHSYLPLHSKPSPVSLFCQLRLASGTRVQVAGRDPAAGLGFVPVQGPGGVVPVASMARMSHCAYAARS